jgi:hypothetical protein
LGTENPSADIDILAFVGGEMKETAQQYTQRILSYVEGKEPLTVQAATADTLDHLIKRVPTSELCKRLSPEKWSVSETTGEPGDPLLTIKING